jgi:hypothetical protein
MPCRPDPLLDRRIWREKLLTDIWARISDVTPGTAVPRPRVNCEVSRFGVRKSEQALFYKSAHHEKNIRRSEFEIAHKQLCGAGELTRKWFEQCMPVRAKQDPCNFTTMGGVFVLLGDALHDPGRGAYRKT